jgi:hypothetical protein
MRHENHLDFIISTGFVPLIPQVRTFLVVPPEDRS